MLPIKVKKSVLKIHGSTSNRPPRGVVYPKAPVANECKVNSFFRFINAGLSCARAVTCKTHSESYDYIIM